MDHASVVVLAKAATTLPMMANALGEAYVVSKAFEAMGRNPEIADSLFTKMIVGVAMVESTAIYALVAFFLIS